MSNPLGIAVVTATLRNLFHGSLPADPELSDTVVTTKHPDLARDGSSLNQLNVFLYQTLHNPAWRNMPLPDRARPGETGQPPLPLDLCYLVTAYGRDDDDVFAHRVLGRAMSLLHDHAVLDRTEVGAALGGGDLHEQVERIRITPKNLSLDEVSKLWSAFQTEYRLSAAYEISVVLIESTRATRTPLPVLTRGPADTGVAVVTGLVPPLPTVQTLTPQGNQPSARLGDTLTLTGHHLDGDTVTAVFSSRRLPADLDVGPPLSATAEQVVVRVPDTAPADWVAGTFTLALRITRAGQPDRLTNEVPLSVAPLLSGLPQSVGPDPNGTATVAVTVSPPVLPGQRAALLLGDREVSARPHAAPTGTLTFDVPGALPGQYLVRVRVDGVDSHLVDRTVVPPVFDATQQVTVT